MWNAFIAVCIIMLPILLVIRWIEKCEDKLQAEHGQDCICNNCGRKVRLHWYGHGYRLYVKCKCGQLIIA